LVHSSDEKQHLCALDFEDSEVPYLEGIRTRSATHSAPFLPIRMPTKQTVVKRTVSLHSLGKTAITSHHSHHLHRHPQHQSNNAHFSSSEIQIVLTENNTSLDQVTPETFLPLTSTSIASDTALTHEEQEDKTWDVKHNTGSHVLGPHVARVCSSFHNVDSSSTHLSSSVATGGGAGDEYQSHGGTTCERLETGDQSSSSALEPPKTWHEKDLQWVMDNFEYTKAPTKQGFWDTNASSRSLREKISSICGSEFKLHLPSFADVSKADQKPVFASTLKDYSLYISAPELVVPVPQKE
jgi:hypothetical protein